MSGAKFRRVGWALDEENPHPTRQDDLASLKSGAPPSPQGGGMMLRAAAGKK
jgi:hypothetical protein